VQTKISEYKGWELFMKKITLELDDKEFQMLQEVTKHLIDEEKENIITDSEMSEAIRALILIFYLNEIVPVKFGENAVVTFEETD
jgi:hypothetical protein